MKIFLGLLSCLFMVSVMAEPVVTKVDDYIANVVVTDTIVNDNNDTVTIITESEYTLNELNTKLSGINDSILRLETEYTERMDVLTTEKELLEAIILGSEALGIIVDPLYSKIGGTEIAGITEWDIFSYYL